MPQLEDVKPGDELIEKKWDTTVLDFLIDQFLSQENDQLLEVLCGYFFKIIKSLLDKQRRLMLEHLLNTRNGDIFEALRRHMNYHSIATLLQELFQIQIKPEDA